MDYRTQCLGEEARLERELDAMEAEIRLDQEQLHCKASPLIKVRDLNGESIAVLGARIGLKMETYKRIAADLAAARRELGR